ncbi:MAG: tRNA (N6-isopentenyl adenosine(37)-C2)-methylthiotransferase MiaB [Planctomycetota bacterium]|nr:tRNA (N6-isopentenyl adenosine(37)-C2)-methylthiotransferase MiaB [Planctomycetota bacterium]
MVNDAVLSPPPRGTPGGPKVLLEVFGCQMNKLDAELMATAVRKAGYDFTDCDEEASAVLLVTCAIRDQAEHRVHSHLGELALLKQQNSDLVIGILGCQAQREGQDLLDRWPSVDFVLGTRDFHRVGHVLDRVRSDRVRVLALESVASEVEYPRDVTLRPHQTRAFVNVMRGCDKRCTYCVVPATRGPEVSRSMEEILSEVGKLAGEGVKEITLLGQTVNAWGRHVGRSLGDLLVRLEDVEGLHRVRFITSHPEEMDDELVDGIASCGKSGLFLHLPPQSGSDAVLRRMARGYTVSRYGEIVEQLRERIPGIEIGADIIVGFCGETDDDFAATYRMVESLKFSQAFIFRYSPRPGTPAYQHLDDDIPDAVKRERLARVLALQKRLMLDRHESMKGKTTEVLVEGASRRDADRLFGRNLAFDRVVFQGATAKEGAFVEVEITGGTELTLYGEATGTASSSPRAIRQPVSV